MREMDFFKRLVLRPPTKISMPAEKPIIRGARSIFEQDVDFIADEHDGRKRAERIVAGPGPRLRQIFTTGPDGRLLKSDARLQAAPTPAPGSAAAATGKKPSRRELRRQVRALQAEIKDLEAQKKP